MKHIIEKIKNPEEYHNEEAFGNSWLLLIYDDETNKMGYEAFPNDIIDLVDGVEWNKENKVWEKLWN